MLFFTKTLCLVALFLQENKVYVSIKSFHGVGSLSHSDRPISHDGGPLSHGVG